MPNGAMPTYAYRPAVGGEPAMKTRNSYRARLHVGGTYFRAKDSGGKGNNISVTAIEYTPDGGVLTGKLIVTNHNTLYSENVSGPVTVSFLDASKLNWNEEYVISNVTTAPSARYYSISYQIAPTEPGTAVDGFAFDKMFYVSGKLGAKLSLNTGAQPTETVTIKARTTVYDLVQKTDPATANPDGTTTGGASGWDIDALRTAIAADPWIEMMSRPSYLAAQAAAHATAPGETGTTATLPLQANADVQDSGSDDEFLTAFDETFLTGGDGLPDTPALERTGPIRSIVFVNYGEAYDGSLTNVNTVYEWVGDSQTAGTWQPY